MVWFQCEDCGENLKKPKLQNHFWICSASKLSCIDCGFTFNRESVQAHTQCVSEQEKYGPKGEGKSINNSEAKGNPTKIQNGDVDLSIGLSTHPPWSCSLCNVKATSRETLLLHSEGKKHRSKARAVQASNKSSQTLQPSLNGNIVNDKPQDMDPSQELSKDGDLQNKEKHRKLTKVETHDSLDERDDAKYKQGEVEHLVCADEKQDCASDSKEPNNEEEKNTKKRKRKDDKSCLLDSMNVENKDDQAGKQKAGVKHKRDKAELSVCDENKQDRTSNSNKDPKIEKENHSKKKKKGDKSSILDYVNVATKEGKARQEGPDSNFISVGQPTKFSYIKEGKSSKTKKHEKIDPMDISKCNNKHDEANKLINSGSRNGIEGVTVATSVKQSKRKSAEKCKQTESEILQGDSDSDQKVMDDANGSAKESSNLPVKWKKIIKSALKSSSDGSLRIKKLQKQVVPIVMKAFESAGVYADESHVKDKLMNKVLSSSRFVVNQKVVRLA